MTTPRQGGLRTVPVNVAAGLRVAAVTHGVMGISLILGGLLLVNSLPHLARWWASALIMAPAIGVSMALFNAGSQQLLAARRQ